MLIQRWRERRDFYRPEGEPIRWDRDGYGVAPIGESVARDFVIRHHYTASYPATRLRVGLFRRAELVGVAIFSVPQSKATVRARAGVEFSEGIELGRFVLFDDVPANGETRFLAEAFRVLRAELPEVLAVVSYSDPLRRTTAAGEVVLPGHVGTIYQAHNARYVGRTKSRTLFLAPNGRELPPRSLSKLRNDDKGAAYAYEKLAELGAPVRRPLESSRAYVARALAEGPFRRLRHPGNHAYVWAIAKSARRSLPEALPYPKLAA